MLQGVIMAEFDMVTKSASHQGYFTMDIRVHHADKNTLLHFVHL